MTRTIGVMARVFDQSDGLGLYCRNLLRHMVALDSSTRYVIFLRTPRHIDEFREFANVRCCVLSAPGKLWWDQIAVPHAARRHGVDLIFNPKFSVPLLTSRPCAFVLQDSDWYINPQNYPWWDNLYIRAMLPLFCRKARRVLVISNFTRDDLICNRVIRPGNATVTHAAVGVNFTERRDEAELSAFRSAHRLPQSFILTVVRAYHTGHPRQPPHAGCNLERLLRAFQGYRRCGGRLHLVIAGERVAEYLDLRGCDSSLLSRVRPIGFVPNERMHLAYQLAEFFILSKVCDSFGLPILEALACGCPAIVPGTCAAPEVAAGAAWFIDPYAEHEMTRAMQELDGSPTLRGQLRARGLERARAFSWPKVARRVLTVLEELP